MKTRSLLCLAFILLIGCKMKNRNQENTEDNSPLSLSRDFYGMHGSDSVFQYTLKNHHGMTVKILDYGATITDILVPDKDGNPGDVVLGYESLRGYEQPGNPYFGCVVGRYANRIAGARFTLNGQEYQLAVNNGPNTLHGGIKGFDKVMWTVRGSNVANDHITLGMEYKSPDGEEGYPGNLTVTCAYQLNDENEVHMTYIATTDKSTPVNITNHSYFNLSAGSDSTILDHELMLLADQYTPVDDQLIPTGKIEPVAGTPMDFTSAKKIGRDIGQVAGGYDHNWVLNRKGDTLEMTGSLYHAGSGRLMEIYTTQPGIQFYSGNFLDGSLQDTRGGLKYVKHAGLCLETQHFPDSPNQPGFPGTILNPGEIYRQETAYKFSVR